MPRDYLIFVGGKFVKTSISHEVKAAYDGRLVGAAYLATVKEMEEAANAAVSAFRKTGRMPPYERSDVLEKISAGIENRMEEIVGILSAEAGKPVKAARQELQRSVFTFRYAAEEARRITGEIIPLDAHVSGKGHACFVKRFPIGPVFGITPFNFPMNLVAHKVAPAIAAGNPIVIKPASKTPLTALILAEIVAESGWPEGGFSVVPAPPELAEKAAADDRYNMLTFTGSPKTGWRLKKIAGKKRVTLELGGNAGVIVDDSADLEDAAARIAAGGFGYAGQTCISVQRIFVHEKVYDRFRKKFLGMVKVLKIGDPLDESTDVGPLITEVEANRVRDWVDEAVNSGAKLLCGGSMEKGSLMEPTVLENCSPEMKVNCHEIFGPVVTLTPFNDMEKAIEMVNDSEYGLQAGIFTRDLNFAFMAWERLSVGGVNVGNVPTFRVDHMPYGGVKLSGLGREGIKYAIEEMTELKNMVIKLPL
ncbi:MAG: aldehyde dehydrogenase [bacterium]|nr:MAG: aldehyde dehydrogenase [bacterium]